MTKKLGWRAGVAVWDDDLAADLRSVEFNMWHLDLEILDTHLGKEKRSAQTRYEEIIGAKRERVRYVIDDEVTMRVIEMI